MYKQSFEDTSLKKGTGSAIREAFQVFCRLFYQPRRYEILRDEVGKIGYEFRNLILVAKRSLNGDVVSVHRTIWDKAIGERKVLVLYMAEGGHFYRFEPGKIKDFVENERGGQKMVNFSIWEGKNLMKLKAQKVKEDIVVDKNSDEFMKELFRQGVFG